MAPFQPLSLPRDLPWPLATLGGVSALAEVGLTWSKLRLSRMESGSPQPSARRVEAGNPAPEAGVPTAQASDAELVRRVAEGDRAALADLYDRHASTLLGLGVRVLRSRREAEDIAHDVFLEVWRRAHSYDPTRASVRGWLCLMMRCRSLDRRKSAGFSLSRPLDDDPRVDGQSPDATLDGLRVQKALAALPDVQREVLLLGYFEGLSSSEIATELGVPIGTVKSRVAAALRALRVALGAEGAQEGSAP